MMLNNNSMTQDDNVKILSLSFVGILLVVITAIDTAHVNSNNFKDTKH
jgi:hypothetical protein